MQNLGVKFSALLDFNVILVQNVYHDLINDKYLCRQTYEKQKIDVKAKIQEKKTAERTLESKVSFLSEV